MSTDYKSNICILHITWTCLFLSWSCLRGGVLGMSLLQSAWQEDRNRDLRPKGSPTYQSGSHLEPCRCRNSISFYCQSQDDASQVHKILLYKSEVILVHWYRIRTLSFQQLQFPWHLHCLYHKETGDHIRNWRLWNWAEWVGGSCGMCYPAAEPNGALLWCCGSLTSRLFLGWY